LIIDCHGHVSAPAQLWAYKATLLASRGSHGRGGVRVTDDDMRKALVATEIGPLLIKTVGPDRCLFGSECPGVGSTTDPDTGHTMDNSRPHIEKFAWLDAEDREKIFAANARKVFKLKI
jgi:OH-DDVA meta-cleavage compound hydrolase